jgi:drug/metabolite transporter (DMT)-like permease
MMWLTAAFLSALVFGISGFLLKMGNHKKYHTPGMLFGLYSAGSLLFLSILLVKGHITLSPLILLFVTSLGIGSYYGNTFLVKAYDLGPACLTSPLISLNILFVILLSTLVYHETLTPWQLSGIGCMITAVALVGCNFKNTLIKSRLWGVFVALAIVFIFMREGGLKIAHEMGLHNSNILFFGYLFAAALALGKLSTTSSTTTTSHYPSILFGLIIGVFSASGMALLAYAIARGPASIILPIFSARYFISVLLLMIFLKEKLSVIQWIAVALLLIGIMFFY